MSAPLVAQAARKDRHVVLISIDGFAAYALNDQQFAIPTIRRLAREGAAAEAMQVVNPSVTWPNHTSMVTGVTPARHSVLYNGRAERVKPNEVEMKVEPWLDKTELVKSPTVYDIAHAAGLTTAEVDWVAILNAKTINWSFAERPRITDAIPQEMGLSKDAIEAFAKEGIVYRDEIWTQAGEWIIEKHKPNLLLFHLLATDSAQHRYGARSLAANTAVSLADAKVARIVDATKRAGIFDRTTFIVVADHGFKTYTQVIHPNALFREKGIEAWCIPEGGTAMIYAKNPAQIPPLFAGVPGISKIVTANQFNELGYPTPEQNDRMANVVLAAADGYAFDGAAKGELVTKVPAGATPGAHGYLSSDSDMDASMVISGSGIRKGAKLGRIRSLDIAPTIAHLLGLRMPDVEGKPLTQVLA